MIHVNNLLSLNNTKQLQSTTNRTVIMRFNLYIFYTENIRRERGVFSSLSDVYMYIYSAEQSGIP